MTKVKLQVCIDPEHFFWLEQERIGRRQKNLSETINEIFKNYKLMIRESLKLQDKKAQTAQIQKEASKIIDDFRASMQEAKVLKE